MKSIKHIILGVVGVCSLVTITSCINFLEEEPLSQKSDPQFWTSENDAQAAVNMIYSSGVPVLYSSRNTGWQPTRLMYNGLLSGLFTDDKKDGDFSSNMETLNITFQTVAGDIGELYREPYVAIGRCNILVSRLSEMLGNGVISKDSYDRMLAQALFFRAYNYFFLIKEFGCKDGETANGSNGGVPLILLQAETPDPSIINIPRASIKEIYMQIEQDLKEAISLQLPNTTFADNGFRITLAAAQTLLANVYLQWAGYPLEEKAKYAEAAKMAELVIRGTSGHELEQNDDNGLNQKSAFNKIKNNKKSKEIIYAIEYNFQLNKGNPYINACMTGQATGWKENDGKAVFKTSVLSNMYHVSDPIIKSYASGDVRGMEKNFFFQTYTSLTGKKFNCNQYDNWFWFDDMAMINSQGTSLNFPVYRLSDVYLMAAEALLKQSTPNEHQAREYLKKVRERAFIVDGVLNPGYNLPATITIDDVLTERLHEFPLEMKVWDDIRRYRLYPQLQTDRTLKWVDITTAKIYNKQNGNGFTDNMHMLIWPIPQSAMERNPRLVQNPGY